VTQDEDPYSEDELAIALRVIAALRKIRYGSLHLQVHEGKVVQFDVAEKLRLLPSAEEEGRSSS
jgi:hypothetical protein